MFKFMLALCALCLVTSEAAAQRGDDPGRVAAAATPRPRLQLPIDPLGLNNNPNLTGDPLKDMLKALDVQFLPDLKYALNRANKSGSKTTAPCYQAWITIIETRQAANVDADGKEIPMPDPHIITSFEDIVELRNALQPDSDFMRNCSPVANMVKMDILHFIGLIMGGGAGLAAFGL